jgi:DNA-binding NarL/FixJ family response regulator
VVAEDNLLVRTGVRALLTVENGIDVVAECAGYDELLGTVGLHEPDVLVTDVRMPPTSTDEGIRAAAKLRSSHPQIGVVLLSQFLDPSFLLALVAEGSHRRGYLLKERLSHAGELAMAIHTVASGGSFIDPIVVDSLIDSQSRRSESALSRLTARERQTLAAIAEGKSNAAIATEFVVSDRAVEKHVSSIFTKLDLYNTPDVNRRVKAVLLFLSGHQV